MIDNPLLRYEKVMGFQGVFADEADHTDENRTTRLDASTVVGSQSHPETEVTWFRMGIDNKWGKADIYLRPNEAREYLTKALAMLDDCPPTNDCRICR